MTQEIVIRKSLKSGGTKTITIIAQKVETSINKILIGLVFPNAKDNQGSGPKENKFVDLQRIERRYNVDGIISYDAGNSVVSGAVFGSNPVSLRRIFTAPKGKGYPSVLNKSFIPCFILSQFIIVNIIEPDTINPVGPNLTPAIAAIANISIKS